MIPGLHRHQKKHSPRSEFTPALQVDIEVDRPPPPDSPPGDLLITMVKETVIIYKQELRKIEKKLNLFVSLIDLIVMKTQLTARLPVAVSSVQTWSEAFGKKFSTGHSYPQADIGSAPYSDHGDTHLTRSLIAVSPQASYDRRRHRNCFPTRPAQAFPKK